MKLALIQMQVKSTPEENLVKAKTLLSEAVKESIDIAVFPEMFACLVSLWIRTTPFF